MMKISQNSETSNRVSKRLESIISRTTKLIHSDGLTTSFSDRLAIELLGNESTTAHRIVRSLASENGITVIMRRIVDELISSPQQELTEANAHYGAMCATLRHTLQPQEINTAHMLYAVAYDTTTATSRTLYSYGIKAEDILFHLKTM